MGNSDVKIEIDRLHSGGTFTNYDVILGTVTLTVTNSVSLNYIQVKLEGISKSELVIPRDIGKKEKKDKVLQDVHKVLYDSLIVFPPENIRNVSNAKEFTLTPGNYTYPFLFKVPLNNSCVKLLGITNKILFNPKKLDFKINNGNFNRTVVRNFANQYVQGVKQSGPPSQHQAPPQQQPQLTYHVTTQLPPSLSGLGEFASIKYFVKVTCKRSSFLKVNLRSVDPFIFLPLDLNSHNEPLFNNQDYEEYREVFIRKDMVFKNRIPEIIGVKVEKTLPQPVVQPKRGFMQKVFVTSKGGLPPLPRRSSNIPDVNKSDVPFSFEIRFRHPSFLIPTKSPSFKLFLVSNVNPKVYSLSEFGKPEESNGLGVVYLQRLIVELTSLTIISVLENDGSTTEIHKSRHDDTISVCNNTYQNLKFDLMNCKKLKSSSSTSTTTQNSIYELEIPKKYFTNCVLPDYLSPSFRTCNIQRKYKLTVVGGFSSEKINDFNNQQEVSKAVRYVDLQMNEIKVLSGLSMTSTLDNNTSTSSLDTPQKHDSTVPPLIPPALPARKESDESLPMPLPTYEDVVKESSYQNDSEHIRARRRYQQHEQYYNNLD